MATFTASVELEDDEAAYVREFAERYGVTVEALLSAALRNGLDQPDGALMRLGVYDPSRASPLDARPPSEAIDDDDIPF